MEQQAPQSRLGLTTGGVLQTPHGDLPLHVTFLYDVEDQAAVTMVLAAEIVMPCGDVIQDSQDWGFARTLIEAAYAEPDTVAGLGDVKVIVSGANIAFELLDLADNGHRVWCDAAAVHHFLQQTLRLVPHDAEHVDVDGAIETLLGGDQ